MTWGSTELGPLCPVITKGTTPRTLGQEYVSNGIPFLRAENLQGDEVCLGPETLYINAETHRILCRSMIYPGDVLISIAGTIGRCAIVPDDMPVMNCNQAVAIVRIAGPLERRFLLHWLKTADAQRQMSGGKVTLTIANLSLGQIKKLRIPLPSPSEQRRIVEILDQADALRKKRAEADAKAARILPALFYEMFGDPLALAASGQGIPLEDLDVDIRNGFACGEKDVEGGVPHLRMNNIDDAGVLNLDLVRTVPLDRDVEHYRLAERDVLFMGTNSEDKVGKTCLFLPPDDRTYLFSNHLVRIRVSDSRITPEYLAAFLHMLWAKRFFPSIAKRWVNQSSVPVSSLSAMHIPLPKAKPLECFTRTYADLLCLRHQRVESSEQINKGFNVLLHRAFTGDLTAKWREAHMKEILKEMEQQAKALGVDEL